MSTPLVSVILPTYNGNKKWISLAIKSVLHQDFSDFEFIIINDASTNDIEKTILAYVEKDKRIRYIKNAQNLKLTKTLNKAIGLSMGKYIARIDDDDIWYDKSKLKKQIKFMEKKPEFGLCGARDIIIIDEQGKKIQQVSMRNSDKDIRNSLLASNQFTHSSVVIRKDVFEDIGLYDPDFNLAEDYELWCRIGTKYKITNLYTLIACRQNTHSVSRLSAMKQKKLALKVCLKYSEHYPHLLKALFMRGIDFVLPQSWIQSILSFLKPKAGKQK